MNAMKKESRARAFARLDNQITQSIERIESESIRLARNLREMAEEREDGKPLWSEGGFSSLKHYCEDRAIGKSRFQQLMTAGQVVERIEFENRQSDHSAVVPTSEGQIRPMGSLVTTNPEAIPAVWDKAIEVAMDDDCEQPEQRHVEEAMREYSARGGNLQATRRKYSERERELKQWCEDGYAVVANKNADHALISWAEEKGKAVYVGRGSEWGNPYQIPQDGDRACVCRNYAKHYIEFKGFKDRIVEELAGKVLVCFCSPETCHADELARRANGE